MTQALGRVFMRLSACLCFVTVQEARENVKSA